MHFQQDFGIARNRIRVVTQPRLICRPNFDQSPAALGDHVRDPEPAADFHQLPPRNNHIPARRRRGQRQQNRRRIVIDDQRRFRPGQHLQ